MTRNTDTAPGSDRVVIASQQRDPERRQLTIDYVLRSGASVSAPTWLLGAFAGVAAFAALLTRPPKSADPRSER